MSGATLNLDWKPPGPVAARFMGSTAASQFINGPIGSGKTTAALMKAIFLAARQQPSRQRRAKNSRGQMAPLRLFKLCVVRDTYRQLWKTTLPSWWKRVPKEIGDFVGSENAPASHHVTFELPDGTLVDFHADFIAIGENSVEDVMRGYEPTAWYLNEADLLAEDVYTFARGRAGRYPDMSDGGPSWYGILADCNAPEFSNWLYQKIFKVTPSERAAMGVELFRQPSGLDPAAENIENLPPGYYTEQAKGQRDWYVTRMVKNQPGYSRAGKPVYPEFVDQLHVAGEELAAIPGIAINIGLDAGLSPAAVFGQRMPNGQWRILDELIAEPGTGATRFGQDLAKRLKDRFEGFMNVRGYADPSAAYGVDKRAGEQTWIEIVAMKAGIRIDAAPTNAVIPRIEAVRVPLTRLIDGEPGYLLSPRCVVLREGFNSGYRYRKLNIPGVEDRFNTEEPEKNEYSHPHDANQYLCSAGGEDLEIRERRQADVGRIAALASQAVHEWDPTA